MAHTFCWLLALLKDNTSCLCSKAVRCHLLPLPSTLLFRPRLDDNRRTSQGEKIKPKDAGKTLGWETKLGSQGPRRLSALSTNLTLRPLFQHPVRRPGSRSYNCQNDARGRKVKGYSTPPGAKKPFFR